MHLLYILERPIQNDLPYWLMSEEKGIHSRVICFQQTTGVLGGNENINQAVFSNSKLYSFNYEFVNSIKGIFNAVRSADTVVIYGHFHAKFRIAILFCKLLNKKLILTSDATCVHGLAGSSGIKLLIKPLVFKVLYNYLASALFVPSKASKVYFTSIGVKADNIVVTPYTINESFIKNQYQFADANFLRKQLNISSDSFIFLFCGKLIERKRPQDILKAFANLKSVNAYLIIVGDGPLRSTLELLASNLGISNSIRFTGFVDYSLLPAYYKIASILVVPAEHEPYGLPVNEAMVCGLPVIASAAVGAAGDLIENSITGWIYPVGNIDELKKLLSNILHNRRLLPFLSENCIKRMKSWSSQSNVDTQVSFFKQNGWLS
ncbi:MAG: glycosyltransferase [Sediminibacterium sp.]|nr:glycosyltransferase [Sediminibacterium sp.]